MIDIKDGIKSIEMTIVVESKPIVMQYEGMSGAKGDTGPQGVQGPRGLTGPQGPQGIPGISPEISVQKINGGHRVTVKDAQGEKSFEVLDGSGTAKVSYVRIPFSILTGSAWNYNADGIYELNIQVPDMPESDGDVFLDVSGISSANAQAYRDEYRKIWSVKTYAGGVAIQALSVPMMDLKMIAGVFVWAT